MFENTSQGPGLPDFTELAEKLQEAARALLAVSGKPGAAFGVNEAEAPPERAPGGSEPSFVICSYEIPDYILRDEQELLEASDSEELLDVLNKVYDHIFCVASLMKNIDQEVDVSGVDIRNIADVLSLPLERLERCCEMFLNFRPIQ